MYEEMGRARYAISTFAIVVGLAACGGGYSWDEGLSESERDDRVESLLTGVEGRLDEAVDSRAVEAGAQMSDDEIVAAADVMCEGLHEGLDTPEIIAKATDEVAGFSSFAIDIIGPPAVDVFCPDLAPAGN